MWFCFMIIMFFENVDNCKEINHGLFGQRYLYTDVAGGNDLDAKLFFGRNIEITFLRHFP